MKKMASAASACPLLVTPVVFHKKGTDGDYRWMVQQSQYDDSIFVFTENFIDSMRIDAESGGGTACLRPLSMYHGTGGASVRAVGVPTGWSVETQGFPQMDKTDVKRAIDLSFDRLLVLLKTTHAHVKRIIYSADASNNALIGTGIFAKTVGNDVVQYISKRLNELPHALTQYPLAAAEDPLAKIRVEELRLLRVALLLDRNARMENKLKRIATAAPPATQSSGGLAKGLAMRQASILGYKRTRP